MRLCEREIDALLLHNAGYLAQKRLARGLKLNYPEAVALISSQALELIRDGRNYDDVYNSIKSMIGENLLQPGVNKMLNEVCVEGTFKDGLKFIRFDNPVTSGCGNIELCMHGSFLPVPARETFEGTKGQSVFAQVIEQLQVEDVTLTEEIPNPVENKQNGSSVQSKPVFRIDTEMKMDTSSKEDGIKVEVDQLYPGKIIIDFSQSEIELNKDREVVLLSVTNLSDEPISIGSHYNFIEANKQLKFDRSIAFGMRLNIVAGESITFLPKETVDVPLVRIGGHKVVKGGNNLVDGFINDDSLKHTLKIIKKRGFAHEQEGVDQRSQRLQLLFKARIPKELYVKKFGPTGGDKIVLGDTNLIVHIEKDFTIYGEELTFGIGKVLREGMGQAANTRNDVALDTIITNAIIIDPMCGVIKADVGIRDGMIQGIGKGGNPNIMSNITPGMVVGVGTEVIQGEGLILTAGAIDSGVCFLSPKSIIESLSNGVTTIFGGGSGSLASVAMSSSGPNHIKYMIQSTDELPVNFGFYAKGNTSKREGLAKELEDQLISGAAGFRANENWGATAAVIDSCLRVADFHDVAAIIDMDSMHESYNPSEIQSLFKNRICGVPISETVQNRSSLFEILKQPNIILASCNANNNPSTPQGNNLSIEDYLHDIGAISIMSSTSQSCGGQVGRLVTKTWQIASKMKMKRGRLSEEKYNDNLSDNTRVKRYLSKYTLNPALFNGVGHAVGSIEPNKMADIVLWKPDFFGVKPEIVIKGGQIAWSQNGVAYPSCQPVQLCKQFGGYGKSPSANSVVFVSKACYEIGATTTYGISKHVEPVKDCRNLTRSNMFLNGIIPKINLDVQTNSVSIEVNNRKETAIDSTQFKNEIIPLAQRYFLF